MRAHEVCDNISILTKYAKKLLFSYDDAPISSMKIIHGCSFTAREKTAAVSLWLSPYHLSVKVLTSRLMKRVFTSRAVALAIMVLPQPGGPYSSTPWKGRRIKDYISNITIWRIRLIVYICSNWVRPEPQRASFELKWQNRIVNTRSTKTVWAQYPHWMRLVEFANSWKRKFRSENSIFLNVCRMLT